MKNMILCIEDDESLIESFNNTISDLKDMGIDIDGKTVKTKNEALQFVENNSLIGVIVDLHLADDGATSGVMFIEKLAQNFNKIPIAIYSGTSRDLGAANKELVSNLCIKIYEKDKSTYDEIILRFRKIADTGINQILGDKGIIEKKLFDIFQKEILPNIDSWISCQSNGDLKEPLTRHAINYLHQIIDTAHIDYLSIEFYLNPKIIDEEKDRVQTGGIYTDIEGQSYFVITPACDLVSKNSNYVQLLPIIPKDIVINTMSGFKGGNGYKTNMRDLSSNQKESLKRCFSNNAGDFLHYFPCVLNIFNGGFINFRNIKTIEFHEAEKYTKILQVSPQFVKDIVARFSSYYARQGQPELSDKKFE